MGRPGRRGAGAMMPGPIGQVDSASMKREKKKRLCTKWDFELRCKLYGFANLHDATRGHIVQEALEIEDEYRWKRFDEHLLACLT